MQLSGVQPLEEAENMSFTCSWVLVKGSLDNVFDPGAPQRAAHEPAVFSPPPGVAQPGPCEFTLELDEASDGSSMQIACNARLCELYTLELNRAKTEKPSYAGSVRSTGGPEGQRVLVVKLARTHRNRPSLLRLRMMYPQPDDQQFELHSWHSEQPSSASRSSSDGSEATVEHMGLSQAEEVRQMLHVLQSGGGGGGGASMGLSALLPRPAEGFRRASTSSYGSGGGRNSPPAANIQASRNFGSPSIGKSPATAAASNAAAASAAAMYLPKEPTAAGGSSSVAGPGLALSSNGSGPLSPASVGIRSPLCSGLTLPASPGGTLGAALGTVPTTVSRGSGSPPRPNRQGSLSNSTGPARNGGSPTRNGATSDVSGTTATAAALAAAKGRVLAAAATESVAVSSHSSGDMAAAITGVRSSADGSAGGRDPRQDPPQMQAQAPAHPMQTLMASIGKAMLLKDKKEQIAKETANREAVEAAQHLQQQSGGLGGSYGQDPGVSPDTELRRMLYQIIQAQETAAQRQADMQASIHALTVATAQLQQGQQALGRDVAACLKMQNQLQSAFTFAAGFAND